MKVLSFQGWSGENWKYVYRCGCTAILEAGLGDLRLAGTHLRPVVVVKCPICGDDHAVPKDYVEAT